MPAFASEQQEILKAPDGKYLSYINSLHQASEECGYRVAAIERTLHEKGLAAPQEVQAVEAEIRAALMVEKAVNPKIPAAEESLRALLEGTSTREQHT